MVATANSAAFAFGQLMAYVLVIGGIALAVLGIVDVSNRPDWAWKASGRSKTRWMVLNVASIVLSFFVVGVIIGLIYLLAVRPKVAAAQRQGAPVERGAGDMPAGSLGQVSLDRLQTLASTYPVSTAQLPTPGRALAR